MMVDVDRAPEPDDLLASLLADTWTRTRRATQPADNAHDLAGAITANYRLKGDDVSEQCTYMKAAYPDLGAEACEWGHRHEPRVFTLARALAVAFQPEPTTDERIAWFLDDANAIVDDFPGVTDGWTVEDLGLEYDDDLDEPTLPGIDKRFKINGVEYVVQESDFEPAHPVKRATFESWHVEETS